MFRALGVSGNSRFGAAAWRAVAGAAISPAIKAAFFIASAQSFTARIEPDPLLPVSNPPSPPAVSASRDAWSRACNVLMSRCWSSFNSSGPFIPDMNSCAWHSASLTSENGIMSFPGWSVSPPLAAVSDASREPHNAPTARATVRRTASTATIGVSVPKDRGNA